MTKKKSSCLSVAVLLAFFLGSVAIFVYTPVFAEHSYGQPAYSLSSWKRFTYSFYLIWGAGSLTIPSDPLGEDQLFVIEQGESVYSISDRLEQNGLIPNADIFRIYLIYRGLDTTIQAGEYGLSSAMTPIEISQALQDATPTEIPFRILAGWRMEEVATSLLTSGLAITSDEFITAVRFPESGWGIVPEGVSAEGFLFPDYYVLPRDISANQLVSVFIQKFASSLMEELRDGFFRQGFDVYQATILASIIEREAIKDDEMPMIASVFINRLNIGMKLETDPTVQYALGYNESQGTWWTNPLSLEDMDIDSSYNTYRYNGLPPGPISNPGLTALEAVAFPAETPYYFFRARCDGSGYHSFAITFDEHLQNACP